MNENFRITRFFTVLFIGIFLVGIIASCARQTDYVSEKSNEVNSEGSSALDDAIEVGLCELDSSLAGEEIRVSGEISFLDDSNPEGVYFDLQEIECQVGVWLDSEDIENISEEKLKILALGERLIVFGNLLIEDDEYFIDNAIIEKYEFQIVQLDPSEEWWNKPQTYHDGEGPNADFTPQMNITVLHDWGSLNAAFNPERDPYWSEEAIKERWNEAHKVGMRVEAVISIIDMVFVEYSSEDKTYDAAGINLYGEHIEYESVESFIGCTNHHQWQEFVKERIFKAIDWGADGIIIDDYEGTSRWISGTPSGLGVTEYGPGGCFCSFCEEGFRDFLREKYSIEELAEFGIENIDNFDYSEYLLDQGWTEEELSRESMKFSGWIPDAEIIVPLYQDYADFQNQAVVNYIKQLEAETREYAREKYQKEISWSVNAGEIIYGAHKFYNLFDRNVAGIPIFSYPPKGAEGYLYRLNFDIHGNARPREAPRADYVVLAVMNEYETNNLWNLKGVEAYANRGAVIEYDYFTFEGSGVEEESTALENDPETKKKINTFYLDHANLFDFQNTQSVANVAVMYSSPSIHYDMYRHTSSFYGLCEILTDLQILFDPIFVGDGISYPDNLDAERLAHYEMVVLPNVTAMTNNQIEVLIDFINNGGTVFALGRFAELNENGERSKEDISSSLQASSDASDNNGTFVHIYEQVSAAGRVVNEDFHDPAALYYVHYIENNHPAVEEFLSIIGEEPNEHINDAAAEEIRMDVAAIIEDALSQRIIEETLSEDIGIQVYRNETDNKGLIVHLINYDYTLETDTINPQNDISLSVLVPEGMNVSSVVLISPDIETEESVNFSIENGYAQFTVPELKMWDVILIE